MIDLQGLPDWFVLFSYRMWSEDVWAAGFMDPSDDVVKEFSEWLATADFNAAPQEDYEHRMLATFRRLNAS